MELLIEDFVPSGVKDFQKKLKAKNSLKILVQYQQPQSQEFLYTLLKDYFLHDFFDAIMNKNDIDENDRFYEWKEFVSLICSIPDRCANMNLLIQESQHNKELNDFNGFFNNLYPILIRLF